MKRGEVQNGVPMCQVDGCEMESRRRQGKPRVCDTHAKELMVFVGGKEKRWCSSCWLYHDLEAFESTFRTCTKSRNYDINRRKRKTQDGVAQKPIPTPKPIPSRKIETRKASTVSVRGEEKRWCSACMVYHNPEAFDPEFLTCRKARERKGRLRKKGRTMQGVVPNPIESCDDESGFDASVLCSSGDPNKRWLIPCTLQVNQQQVNVEDCTDQPSDIVSMNNTEVESSDLVDTTKAHETACLYEISSDQSSEGTMITNSGDENSNIAEEVQAETEVPSKEQNQTSADEPSATALTSNIETNSLSSGNGSAMMISELDKSEGITTRLSAEIKIEEEPETVVDMDSFEDLLQVDQLYDFHRQKIKELLEYSNFYLKVDNERLMHTAMSADRTAARSSEV